MVARTRLNVTLYVLCLSFKIVMNDVYCAVQTGSLSVTQNDQDGSLKDSAIIFLMSHLTALSVVQSMCRPVAR